MENQAVANGRNPYFEGQHPAEEPADTADRLALVAERDRLRADLAAERERSMIALREWAVSRWRDEVQHRPLENKHRRSLDDCWRQVMRYAGLDPDEAVGPSHDALLASRVA